MTKPQETLEELSRQLGAGEITPDQYKKKLEDLLSQVEKDASSSSESDPDGASTDSSVADDRIKTAFRKARSLS